DVSSGFAACRSRPSSPTRRSSDLVCDGLGGHDGGEHASRVAAETVVELAVPAEGADSLVTAIRAAHERVVERGLELGIPIMGTRSEEHTSELQSRENLVCRLLLEK